MNDELLTTYYKQDALRKFLPSPHWSNASMDEFLYPPTSLYEYIKHYAGDIKSLAKWDQVPEKFLDHIASNFDFELLGMPYATVSERRKLIRDVIYIYRRKGAKTAIEQLVTDLGFGYSWTDPAGLFFPFIANQHKSYNLEDIWISRYSNDFATSIQDWDQLNIGAWWRLDNGRLRVKADGTDSYTNAMTIAESYGPTSVLSVDFYYEILSTGGAGFLGFFVWTNINTWWRIGININGSAYITRQGDSGGGVVTTNILQIDNILSTSEYLTGQHRIRMLLNLGTSAGTLLAFSIDDKNLIYNHPIATEYPSGLWTKRGLFAINNYDVAFDSFLIQSINQQQTARTFEANPIKLNYVLTLTGNPYKKTNKVDFIKEIIGNYVPFNTKVSVVS